MRPVMLDSAWKETWRNFQDKKPSGKIEWSKTDNKIATFSVWTSVSRKHHWSFSNFDYLCICVFDVFTPICVSHRFSYTPPLHTDTAGLIVLFVIQLCYKGLRVNFTLEFRFKGLLSRAGVLCSSLSRCDDLQRGEKRHEIKHLPQEETP